jgi:HAD superfamily hydrolase (TIGR01509 family)
MIKVVIFDLNGVFIKSPKLSDRFKESFGVEESEFMPALKEIMAKVRLPNAGDAFSYWAPYLKKWNIHLNCIEFFDFWFTAEKEVPEMIALAKELKNDGIKIFILSNNFKERAEYYDKTFPWLKEIAEKTYYSWQTGFIKPNAMAYKQLLLENNWKPGECIYFDDVLVNIEVAQSLGIKSCLFKDAAETKKILKQILGF